VHRLKRIYLPDPVKAVLVLIVGFVMLWAGLWILVIYGPLFDLWTQKGEIALIPFFGSYVFLLLPFIYEWRQIIASLWWSNDEK